ncbi:MAG: hypothetical protein QOF09_651 [Alphaproteobacteria bacterium]|jgi:hypothetical protein|nr:hypothetical protein [Alphaproteobacteria bacterium]
MKPLQTFLLAAAAVGAGGGLSAASAMRMAPLAIEGQATHQVRVVCDEYGRCFETGPRYRDRGYDPCPEGYTVQGGVCQPYRGPYGPSYGRRDRGSPCPPRYTVQDGVCKPYRGP